jgi:hypothetical protein
MADQTGQPCWCAALPVETQLPIYPELVVSDMQVAFARFACKSGRKIKSPTSRSDSCFIGIKSIFGHFISSFAWFDAFFPLHPTKFRIIV